MVMPSHVTSSHVLLGSSQVPSALHRRVTSPFWYSSLHGMRAVSWLRVSGQS